MVSIFRVLLWFSGQSSVKVMIRLDAWWFWLTDFYLQSNHYDSWISEFMKNYTELVWPSAFKTNRHDPIQFKSIHSFNLTNGTKIHQKPSDSSFKPVNKNVRMENFRSCHNYLIQLNLALWSLINTSNTFQYLSFPDNNIPGKRDASSRWTISPEFHMGQ